ncbi:hypothetical protein L243_28875 [Salmonella enterica subsp. enterica serovar Worthington str. BCH-3008]|nr:hypothetical protein L243_28875 [Salmonella enterica subsp. enterica serovar Worthington str. BCH-3008]
MLMIFLLLRAFFLILQTPELRNRLVVLRY